MTKPTRTRRTIGGRLDLNALRILHKTMEQDALTQEAHTQAQVHTTGNTEFLEQYARARDLGARNLNPKSLETPMNLHDLLSQPNQGALAHLLDEIRAGRDPLQMLAMPGALDRLSDCDLDHLDALLRQAHQIRVAEARARTAGITDLANA